MEKLDSTSELLQSRLSSLSFSSFPGVTSHQGDTAPPDRLQSTDLSTGSRLVDRQPEMESREEPSQTEKEPEQTRTSSSLSTSEVKAAEMPPLKPATTWTSAAMKELKAKLRAEKDAVVTVYRGDIMTVHVPTVPEAKKVCWEFATDGYDIGFGVYFDCSPVTSRSITVHVSESSDDEDEEDELEAPVSNGDVEKGSKSSSGGGSSSVAEILPVYRQDSHMAVCGGSHEFAGDGTYLLKFDNSYSLWRNKTLYYRVHYSA
ncbi:protein TMED8 isoform 1-T1 [Synchiropus picturatus]